MTEGSWIGRHRLRLPDTPLGTKLVGARDGELCERSQRAEEAVRPKCANSAGVEDIPASFIRKGASMMHRLAPYAWQGSFMAGLVDTYLTPMKLCSPPIRPEQHRQVGRARQTASTFDSKVQRIDRIDLFDIRIPQQPIVRVRSIIEWKARKISF
jgi:hypothetical protein